MEVKINSLQELGILAKEFAKQLKGGEVIALEGQLGAGKTAFVKELLKAAGVQKNVASPTFVLMIPYKKGAKTFYHMDLYRLNGFEDIQTLGIPELWQRPENIFLIEWADKIKRRLPKDTIYFQFEIKDNYRRIKITNAPKGFKI